jgi:hypothetical protein
MMCKGVNNPFIPYEPSVYFTGNINGDYDSLIGNREFPNRCFLVQDTIRMYFYTKGFKEENQIRNGDMIRLDIYPGNDTVIGRARLLFHMARYYEKNSSYTINQKDTIYGTDRIQFEAWNVNRRRGGAILITHLTVTSRPVPGTNGEHLQILNASIRGKIE